EPHPATLATGELAEGCVPRDAGKQAVDDVADAGIRRPLVLLPVADDALPDHQGVVELVALVEHAERDAAAARDSSSIRFNAAGEEAQQGGLAVAIAPDDADPFTLVDADGDLVEDDAGRVFEVKRFRAEEMGHPSTVVGVRSRQCRWQPRSSRCRDSRARYTLPRSGSTPTVSDWNRRWCRSSHSGRRTRSPPASL